MIEIKKFKTIILIVLPFILALAGQHASAQESRIGVTISPVITWFGSGSETVTNQGSRPGSEITVRYEKYFTDNFAFTAGISLLGTGGRLKRSVPVDFLLPERTVTVGAGNPIVYRIRYLSVPAGVKFRTNERNLLSFTGEVGIDPEVVVTGRVDIPSLDIRYNKAMTQINRFNLGYHINGGIEYKAGEALSLILGLGFENNFLDVTRDRLSQENDRITQRFIKFILGVNFLRNE
jgi:hypothetical protein